MSALFTKIMNLFSPSRQELFSLNEVRRVLHPRGERYRGMQTVPISKIVGSEGRYRDFNKQFLPRHEYLRGRWESIDKAHLRDVILPPILLYEIGGVYFVRDGNHRVSVAKSQGVLSIDAEVISLDTEIPLHESLTRDGLRKAVIEHEKQLFLKRTRFDEIVGYDLNFSATGRYDEIEQHIQGHKYFLNQHEMMEIPLERAMISWYRNVFLPIVEIIEDQKIISRFPGRTCADLYLWIVRRWNELKIQYGQDFPMADAVTDYTKMHGTGFWKRILSFFGSVILRKHRDPGRPDEL